MNHVPLIKIADYERIHGIANAILEGQKSEPHKSCLFFSMAGAYILTKNLKIEAHPVAGAAFFCVIASQKNEVLHFADVNEDRNSVSVESNEKAFHCWVESGDWVIDFMAPLFGRAAKDIGFSKPIPARMFQKKKNQMSESIDMCNVGDYFMLPNQELTNKLLLKNLARNDVKDFLEIASNWFKPAAKKMQREMIIGSNAGEATRLHIKPTKLNSKW